MKETAKISQGVIDLVAQALAAGRINLAFQPVVMARATRRVAFHEALVRVIDPSGRVVPAGFFIEAVEDLPLGRQLDAEALRLGLLALQDAPDLRLSVNLSAKSLQDAGWWSTLEAGLAGDPTLAERLVLEITERAVMQSPIKSQDALAKLQTRGISIALDDFGAGQTAFRHLRDFRFDLVKIDGSFCRDIATDPDNRALVTALVGLGAHFDMMIVAEHVACGRDAAVLAGLGVDCLQGFHFGRPVLKTPNTDQDPARLLA
ncbi:MAG: EAL domain-containing protein [Pseudomonadota bacterium]